jgi:hypothetical protein
MLYGSWHCFATQQPRDFRDLDHGEALLVLQNRLLQCAHPADRAYPCQAKSLRGRCHAGTDFSEIAQVLHALTGSIRGSRPGLLTDRSLPESTAHRRLVAAHQRIRLLPQNLLVRIGDSLTKYLRPAL